MNNTDAEKPLLPDNTNKNEETTSEEDSVPNCSKLNYLAVIASMEYSKILTIEYFKKHY